MGGPFATGLGTLGLLLVLVGIFVVPPALIIVGFILILIAVALVLVRTDAGEGETHPDPVTGGPRWWQKRWDE